MGHAVLLRVERVRPFQEDLLPRGLRIKISLYAVQLHSFFTRKIVRKSLLSGKRSYTTTFLLCKAESRKSRRLYPTTILLCKAESRKSPLSGRRIMLTYLLIVQGREQEESIVWQEDLVTGWVILGSNHLSPILDLKSKLNQIFKV